MQRQRKEYFLLPKTVISNVFVVCRINAASARVISVFNVFEGFRTH